MLKILNLTANGMGYPFTTLLKSSPSSLLACTCHFTCAFFFLPPDFYLHLYFFSHCANAMALETHMCKILAIKSLLFNFCGWLSHSFIHSYSFIYFSSTDAVEYTMVSYKYSLWHKIKSTHHKTTTTTTAVPGIKEECTMTCKCSWKKYSGKPEKKLFFSNCHGLSPKDQSRTKGKWQLWRLKIRSSFVH